MRVMMCPLASPGHGESFPFPEVINKLFFVTYTTALPTATKISFRLSRQGSLPNTILKLITINAINGITPLTMEFFRFVIID